MKWMVILITLLVCLVGINDPAYSWIIGSGIILLLFVYSVIEGQKDRGL